MPKWDPDKGCWEQTPAPAADVKSDKSGGQPAASPVSEPEPEVAPEE